MNVPDKEQGELDRVIEKLGFQSEDESDNAAYQMFMR